MLSIALVALLSAGFSVAQENGAVGFCTDAGCTDCPNSVTTSGTGYPNCVVYNSGDIFKDADYPPNPQGGFMPFVDIGQPALGCQVIVKSPASTTVQGCGTTIGAFSNAVCAAIDFKETFMVQFCCGTGDCTAAGGNDKRDSGALSSGALFLANSTGQIIPPAAVGKPPALDKRVTPVSMRTRRAEKNSGEVLGKRDCSNMQWVVSSDNNVSPNGKDGYTRPAPNTDIVYPQTVNGGTGGNSVTISTQRTTSFSYTAMAGINIEIFSAGVSFTYEQSTTSSVDVMFSIPAGQNGRVGFTPTWRCTMGQLICADDGSVLQDTSEACSGFSKPVAGGTDLQGTYAVIIQS